MNTARPRQQDHRHGRSGRLLRSGLLSLLLHGLVLLLLSMVTWVVIAPAPPDPVIQLAGEDDDGAPDVAGAVGGARGSSTPTAPSATPTTMVPALPVPAASSTAIAPLPQPSLPDEAFAGPDALERLDPPAAPSPAGGIGAGTGVGPALGAGAGLAGVVGVMNRRGLDLVVVLDATRSMTPYIMQAKRRLRQVLAVVSALLGTNPARFGVVAYKDYGDDYGFNAVRSLELTLDHAAVRRFIDDIVPGGGGDEPEPIHEALEVATSPAKMGWKQGRVAMIILVGDSSVSLRGREPARRLARDFARGRLRGAINVIDADENGDGLIQPDLNAIATAGGGTAYVLQKPDDFWRHLIVSVFGRRFEHDVQAIIDEYAGDADP